MSNKKVTWNATVYDKENDLAEGDSELSTVGEANDIAIAMLRKYPEGRAVVSKTVEVHELTFDINWRKL